MSKDSNDVQILSQEQRCIELLARETNTATATVQDVFLSEYKRIAATAHIRLYLPLLTGNSVRGILQLANSSKLRAPVRE